MRILLPFLLAGVTSGVHISEKALSRQKRGMGRANVQACTVTPIGIEDPATPAKTNTVIEFQCRTDTEFTFCQFQHLNPLDVGQSYSANSEAEIDCTIAGGETQSKNCPDDSRITMTSSLTSCGIRISNPTPEDTGKWTLIVGEVKNTQVQSTSKIIEVYTYNQTEVMLQEKRSEIEISNTYDIWYNFDERRNEWRDGTSGFERIEIQCNARYGRPIPEITWTINRDERNELHSQNNIFTIRDGTGDTHDATGYIKDWVSEFSFEVNEEFMAYLAETHSIDVNPESGEFTFDLDCIVDQGTNGEYNSERVNTRVNVKRIYNSNAMKGTTIGMIVGIVLAVLIAIVVVLVLVFAKATERWCFADDEYQYRDPQEKRRPHSQAQR
eukprot:GFUD01042718.1.p1 GENE.GFUD01042718.1~~GFUD01042718.1.p1  ORF type:complete len:383 (+),score=84.20 GFUD01042718.1:162-1310(+)